MSRPTDEAIRHFGKAANKSYLAATMKDDQQLAWAVNELAAGLWQMAIGLRATYVLLDEVKDILRPRSA